MPTKIEWATDTWNPITGCTPISDGCKNCYAEKMAKRLKGRFGYPVDDPFRPGVIHKDKLGQPSKWKKPRKIFVCSMGDLFHDAVSFEMIQLIVDRMHYCGPRHTFMILTKRPKRVLEWKKWVLSTGLNSDVTSLQWFQKKIWLGITAENQRTADERIPALLQIPADVRFVSVEPMLERIDIEYYLRCPGCGYTKKDMAIHCDHHLCTEKKNKMLDWVIIGSETGPDKRPMDLEWARSLRDQCKAAGVPFFFKKATGETPDDLMVREWPI